MWPGQIQLYWHQLHNFNAWSNFLFFDFTSIPDFFSLRYPFTVNCGMPRTNLYTAESCLLSIDSVPLDSFKKSKTKRSLAFSSRDTTWGRHFNFHRNSGFISMSGSHEESCRWQQCGSAIDWTSDILQYWKEPPHFHSPLFLKVCGWRGRCCSR